MSKIVLFIIFISSMVVAAAGASRSGYGESCDAAAKCNKAAWLACQDNLCVCSRYNEMIYDPVQKSCVVSAGERCRIAIGEDEDARHMRYDVLKCVTNAACGSEGICKCGPGTFETDDGFCSLKKGYLSNCNSTNQCAEGELLTCVGGVCGCDPETALYVRDGAEIRDQRHYRSASYTGNRFTQCAGLPGKACLSNRCVANAFCDSSIGKCKCMDSFTESSKGCLPGFGHQCAIGVQCASSLNCVEDKCRCKYPASQYVTGSSCISYVGGPCEPSEMSKCAPNSECVTKDSYSVCQCKPDYVRAPDGFCDIDYGSPCPRGTSLTFYTFGDTIPFTYVENQQQRSFVEKCNRNIPLICVNGMCDCPDAGMVYDSARAKCVWLVGFDCDTVGLCVANATCRQEIPGSPNRCSCAEGFVTETDRTCSKVDVVVGIINIDKSVSDTNSSTEDF